MPQSSRTAKDRGNNHKTDKYQELYNNACVFFHCYIILLIYPDKIIYNEEAGLRKVRDTLQKQQADHFTPFGFFS
jgi:hypothetical protein